MAISRLILPLECMRYFSRKAMGGENVGVLGATRSAILQTAGPSGSAPCALAQLVHRQPPSRQKDRLPLTAHLHPKHMPAWRHLVHPREGQRRHPELPWSGLHPDEKGLG